MLHAVWSDPGDVDAALARLGLALPDLIHAVHAGYVSRISRTANDAPNAPGLYQWNDTLRALREQLALRGWHRDNTANFATVVNPRRTLAVAVSSGNPNTGRADRIPSTSRHKGSCTAERVSTNAVQMELFPTSHAVQIHNKEDESETVTWTLLFHTDRHEIRSELSLAVRMDAQGQIEDWRERIILPVIPLDEDGDNLIVEPDFGPDVDIDVIRRA
jgi:hypothetical protein